MFPDCVTWSYRRQASFHSPSIFWNQCTWSSIFGQRDQWTLWTTVNEGKISVHPCLPLYLTFPPATSSLHFHFPTSKIKLVVLKIWCFVLIHDRLKMKHISTSFIDSTANIWRVLMMSSAVSLGFVLISLTKL